LGLPEEEFETEVAISLPDSSWNVLEFRPIYRRSGKSPRIFWRGISRFDIFFNGKAYVGQSTKGDARREE
jgi:hypothetical protein